MSKTNPTATPVLLMGILNVTPDSFSDGGRFVEPQAAVDRALAMVEQGAGVIDMGAESTRPGSRGVPAREQLRRLLPVLRRFRARSRIPVSIDTRSATVARACLDAGAAIINDVSALRHDPDMLKTLAPRRCKIVLMHMQGSPGTMQRNPVYADVAGEILAFFRARIRRCEAAGIRASRLWLDPGIGFGKTLEHNLDILRRLDELSLPGLPLVVGVSRKGFLGKLTNEPIPERRVAASVAAGVLAVARGASILRVHDVAEHASALRVAGAALNFKF
jgi:dihydropteroate synthase